jgi:hypothetical protein
MIYVRTEFDTKFLKHFIRLILLFMSLNQLGAATAMPDSKCGEANPSDSAVQFPITKELPALSILQLGASVPYVRYEAEEGVLSGAAAIVGPNRLIGDLGGEASGRKAVKLTRPCDGVEWSITADANSIVIRYCVPDSADGTGLDATISVYVNGIKRDTLELTSKYAWLYGPEGDPQNKPSLGSPRHIYDESHKLFNFTLKKGDKILLRKDATDTGNYYGIDFIELEMVAPPIRCPADFVNIADEGITPENFGSKIDLLLQSVGWNARYKGKKGLYFPPGRYKMESMAKLHKSASIIEIKGAGMWYTVLYDERGRAADWGTPGFNMNGLAAHFSDLAMFGSSNNRGVSGKPFVNCYGSGTIMKNIWIEHMTCGFWVGGSSGISDHLTIDGCRLRNLGADGINLCNGTKNSTITNTTVRSSGDDGIAIWSAPEMDGPADGIDYPGCANNIIQNCTVELPWRANCFAIYGGKDNTIKNCIARDTLTYAGVNISSTFRPRPFSGRTLVDNVLIERCGGSFWSGQQFGALWVMADDGPISDVTFSNIYINDSTFCGIMLKSETFKSVVREMNVKFENVMVVKSGTHGILVQDAIGTADFRNTKLLQNSEQPVRKHENTNGKKGTGTIKFTMDDKCVGIIE